MNSVLSKVYLDMYSYFSCSSAIQFDLERPYDTPYAKIQSREAETDNRSNSNEMETASFTQQ